MFYKNGIIVYLPEPMSQRALYCRSFILLEGPMMSFLVICTEKFVSINSVWAIKPFSACFFTFLHKQNQNKTVEIIKSQDIS